MSILGRGSGNASLSRERGSSETALRAVASYSLKAECRELVHKAICREPGEHIFQNVIILAIQYDFLILIHAIHEIR